MKLGIVGSEAAKFTPETERKARDIINSLVCRRGVTGIVSGGCHLGGVDIYAEEATQAYNLFCPSSDVRQIIIHIPQVLSWRGGYAPRNLAIVRDSDEVHCITVASLPVGYTGMRFPLCYHCARAGGEFLRPHVKSGGCWTMHQAIKRGKVGRLHVV